MSDLDFDGRTALITGAGGGLGREYALLLASRGARVAVNDLGGATADSAQRVVDEIRASGGTAIANGDSVSDPAGARAMVDAAVEAFGQLDIVINNAGILRDKAFHNMTEPEIDVVIDVHLRGSFYVSLHAWQHMRGNRYGRIINTTSNSGLIGNFGQSNYGAAKMGVVGLTRVLAAEGRSRGIHVNAVAPAATTQMTESFLTPEAAAALNPARVAPVVAWLAHSSCETTGEIISAGGGRLARYFIGLTAGYGSRDLTVEEVREHWDEARDIGDFTVPETPADELRQFLAMWEA
jgi:NAD(P)-dependent dehydrogenase (short-subunit alcohol dehydrogenase family)